MREPGIEPGSQDWQPCIRTIVLLTHYKKNKITNLFKAFPPSNTQWITIQRLQKDIMSYIKENN
jgi:hypothetical protein